jgi:acyl dehydratase
MNTLVVREGDELPPFTRRAGFAEWNRFAAVNDEFVPIHMDDEAGRKAGLPSAIGMGLLQVAYLHNMIRDWLSGSGKILSFSCRFGAPSLKGDTVSAHGKVRAVTERDGRLEAELEIWTQNEAGERLAPGTCRVALDP